MLSIHSSAYRKFRAEMKRQWKPVNKPCGICGQATIRWDATKDDPEAFELDHKISRKRMRLMNRPDLMIDPGNAQPSHKRCNAGKQDGDGPAALGERTEDW